MKSSKRKVPSSSYIILVPALIFVFKLMEVALPKIGVEFVPASRESLNLILSNFISAFSILYGVLLPLFLVRTLENFHKINQDFEVEANVAKVLCDDLLLLSTGKDSLKVKLMDSLHKYALHVKDNHQDEANDLAKAKSAGDEILENLRREYAEIVSSKRTKTVSEAVISELLQRLAELENARTIRIESSKEMFTGLGFQFILAITASMFLIPFYIGFTPKSSILENIFLIFLTLIVIFLNIVIDDLNQPYNGVWKIDSKSWQKIVKVTKLPSSK